MAVSRSTPSLTDIWKGEIRLRSVRALPGFRLSLEYKDGETYEVDLSEFVGTGGFTDPLADPEFFAKVKVADYETAIEWPNEVDIGSDTLRWDGELARRGLTREDVGED